MNTDRVRVTAFWDEQPMVMITLPIGKDRKMMDVIHELNETRIDIEKCAKDRSHDFSSGDHKNIRSFFEIIDSEEVVYECWLPLPSRYSAEKAIKDLRELIEEHGEFGRFHLYPDIKPRE